VNKDQTDSDGNMALRYSTFPNNNAHSLQKQPTNHLIISFSGSGIGDVCKGDWDGDGVPDAYDASKSNNKITFTDFRRLQNVNLDQNQAVPVDPVWVVRKKVTLSNIQCNPLFYN
jgi:hypothetical protein